AVKLTKLTRADSKMLPECLAEGGMCIITGGQRHLGNIHRAHPQLVARTLQADTPDIAGHTFPGGGGEDSMQMWHRKACDLCQYVPMKRLVHMLADVFLNLPDAAVMMSVDEFGLSPHEGILSCQNKRSLFQMYHLQLIP